MNQRFNWIFKLGCFSMISLIGLGAKYGHIGRLNPQSTQLFNKAQLYHLINNVALLILALSGRAGTSVLSKVALGGFIGGLGVFCAPMYHYAISGRKSAFSQMMPIGGVSMLVGWGALMFA